MEISREQILRIFESDSEENLRSMEESLILLESDHSDDESLQTIFRVAHTLKGDAATLGFQRLARFAHAAESALDRLRKGSIQVSSALISRMLRATDIFRILVSAAVSGADEIPQDMEELQS